MALAGADETIVRPASMNLPPITDETRAIVARCEARRIALMGDQQVLRDRYETVMQWLNPPWDAISRRADPRPGQASAERRGMSKLHVDLLNPAVDRWAVLQAGAPFVFRVAPPYVASPIDHPDDPDRTQHERRMYDINRQLAQDVSSRMENQTQEWIDDNDFYRTMLWVAWSKEAFGKAIVRLGWDAIDKIPTAELMENPSTVYYGWDRRYGRRKLAWLSVVEEVSPFEANRRWDLNIPQGADGTFDLASWTGLVDDGDMDQRPEQQSSNQAFVNAIEYHELIEVDGKTKASCAVIVAGRVVQGPWTYPWSQIPFRVFENQHIPTWQHGKSTAEAMIPINEAMDDMLSRQHEVIEFESGPRYVGLNMGSSQGELDVPPPFGLLPLREGEDIKQLETRIDFFPSELHSNQLYEAIHRSTGLTPIAWGMSPNAQTSGRAMSAEWRAVELPMTGRLVNMGPEVKAVMFMWWEIAAAYDADIKRLGQVKGLEAYEGKDWRRFECLWVPLDIRDKTEKTLDIIQRLNNNILDPESAIEESGYQNVDEIMARIKTYMVDPIYNPLRYQQYLTLQQLELQIRQMEMEVQAQEAAQQGANAAVEGSNTATNAPSPEQLAAQGANAAVQGAQAPGGPVTEGQNQPGMSPEGGGLPLEASILSQTPLQNGIGNRIILPLGGEGPSPTSGNQPS